MKTLAMIVEYNPFHLGHKYHLEQSKKDTGASHTIAIMSGSFVQRGEPSLVDKWSKAEMAIRNGVDLVIELPFIFSSQSAELFAYGGIKIMDSLNIVDYISFGAENRDIEKLEHIAAILVDEPNNYKKYLKEYLNSGNSYPKSRELAILDYMDKDMGENRDNYLNIMNQSNNILAIEYLKALKKLNSNIDVNIVTRKGALYKDIETKSSLASATGIRNMIFKSSTEDIKNLVPKETYKILKKYEEKYKFNHLNNYTNILNYLLLTKDSDYFSNFFDIDEDLANRFENNRRKYRSIDEFINVIDTKRYSKTRLQRSIVHLMAELEKDVVIDMYEKQIPYIRILGANKKGFEIINHINKNSDLKIINKFSDYKKLNNDKINIFLQYEELATDLFFLKSGNTEYNMDYIQGPFILK